MHRSPVVLSVVFSLTCMLSAEVLSQKVKSSASAIGKSIHTFEIRAYSDRIPERARAAGVDAKKTGNGLVFDYYLFNDSGFRVSAGTFSTEQSNLIESYATGSNKAYLGVGWKKLLDDARRLDVSVEFGAFFGEEAANEQGQGNKAVADIQSSQKELDITVKTASPMINFGIQYRF